MLSGVVSLVLFMAASVSGANVANCADQANCIRISIEEVNSTLCGDNCEYKVCLTADFISPCIKEGSISHTCAPLADTCANGFDFDDGSLYNDPEVFSGDVICQYAGPSQNVAFILKDGNMCQGEASLTTTDSFLLTATCRPTNVAEIISPQMT